MVAAFTATDDRRTHDRLTVARKAVLRLGTQVESIALEDLTSGGCRFFCEADLPLAAPVSIGIAGVGHTPGRVAWRSGPSYGCAFDRPMPAGAVTAQAPDNVARMAQAVPEWQVAEEEETRPSDVIPLSLRARVAIISGLTGSLWTAIFGVLRMVL